MPCTCNVHVRTYGDSHTFVSVINRSYRIVHNFPFVACGWKAFISTLQQPLLDPKRRHEDVRAGTKNSYTMQLL